MKIKLLLRKERKKKRGEERKKETFKALGKVYHMSVCDINDSYKVYLPSNQYQPIED